jgi:hypothetical protein
MKYPYTMTLEGLYTYYSGDDCAGVDIRCPNFPGKWYSDDCHNLDNLIEDLSIDVLLNGTCEKRFKLAKDLRDGSKYRVRVRHAMNRARHHLDHGTSPKNPTHYYFVIEVVIASDTDVTATLVRGTPGLPWHGEKR